MDQTCGFSHRFNPDSSLKYGDVWRCDCCSALCLTSADQQCLFCIQTVTFRDTRLSSCWWHSTVKLLPVCGRGGRAPAVLTSSSFLTLHPLRRFPPSSIPLLSVWPFKPRAPPVHVSGTKVFKVNLWNSKVTEKTKQWERQVHFFGGASCYEWNSSVCCVVVCLTNCCVTCPVKLLVFVCRCLVSASQDGKLIIWDSYTTNKVRAESRCFDGSDLQVFNVTVSAGLWNTTAVTVVQWSLQFSFLQLVCVVPQTISNVKKKNQISGLTRNDIIVVSGIP